MSGKRALLFIFLTAFLTYANVLTHEFIGDSHALFVGNSFYKNPANIVKVFTSKLIVDPADFAPMSVEGAESFSGFISYRPVTALSFFLDSFLWKSDSRGYYFTNILLHFITAVLVWILGRVILKNETAALIAALLFCAHPINTEVVNHIGYRSDILAAIFQLLALIGFIRYRKKEGGPSATNHGGWALIAFFLALFTKESAVTLIVVFALYDVLFKKKLEGRAYTPFLGVLGFYLVVYFVFFKSAHYSQSLNFLPAITVHLSGVIKIFYNYLLVLFLPFTVTVLPPLYSPGTNLYFYEWLAVFVFLIGSAWAGWRSLKGERTIAFLTLWFFLAYVPASNIIPLPNPMAFRFMYLPSAVFALCLAVGIEKIVPKNFLKAVLIGVLMVITFSHNWFFKNNFITCLEMVRHYPQSRRPHWILGMIYLKDKDYVHAIAHFEKYLRLPPENPFAQDNQDYFIHHQLGRCYVDDPDAAIAEFNKAVALKPDYVFAHVDLARAYLLKKDYTQSLAYGLRAIELNPDWVGGYVYAIHSYAQLGNIAEAKELLRQALRLAPQDRNLKHLARFVLQKENKR